MAEKLQPLELYRIVRAQVEHEDNLVSQRLSWLLAAQSFLFTAYAISLNGPVQLRVERLADRLTTLLPIVGICTAILLWITILAGIFAMRTLRVAFERCVSDLPKDIPPIQTRGATLFGGQIGPFLVPPLFIVIWLFLLVRG
mgnify:CR=1 FL=1